MKKILLLCLRPVFLVSALVVFILVSGPVMAQTTTEKSPAGFWLGTIDKDGLQVIFNISEKSGHSLETTIDSLDQNAFGIPVSLTTFEKGHLRLEVPLVKGSYDGQMSGDGTRIEGKWFQSQPLALSLKKISAAEKKAVVQKILASRHPAVPFPFTAQVNQSGSVYLTDNERKVASAWPLIFTEGWKPHPFTLSPGDPAYDGVAVLPEGGRVGLQTSLEVLKSGVHVHAVLTALDPVTVTAARLNLDFPYDDWMGASFQLGGTQGAIPAEKSSNIMIANGDSATLSMGPAANYDGLTANLVAPQLSTILQDSRQWGGSLSAILSHGETSEKLWVWKAGEKKDFDFTLTFNREFALPPTQAPKASKDLSGTWCARAGGLQNPSRTDRMMLRIQKVKKGKYEIISHDYDLYGGGQDVYLEKAAWKKGTLRAEGKEVLLNLRLDPSGTVLEGTLQTHLGEEVGQGSKDTSPSQGKIYPISFHRGLEYLVPRVDAQGNPVTQYSYQLPQTLADGWPVGDLNQSRLDSAVVGKGIGQILNQRFFHIESLLVVQKGQLLLDEYFRGLGPDDNHQLQSCTKSVLATLFGIARDQGLVKLSDKLYDYFPDYRAQPGWQADKNRITLANLLSMSSGLACDDWLPPGDNCNKGMWGSQDWLSYDLTLPMDHAPGEHFAYTTSCMELLGAIIARKSGLTIPDFAQKYLYDPLGIQARQWVTGPNQVTEVGGSHCLRPRDMAKLGYLYLKKGKWNGHPILSEDWVERATRPQVPNPKENPRTFEYGYLWWQEQMPLQNRKVSVFYAAGRGGQFIFVAPDLDLVCVLTANNYDGSQLASEDFFKAYILGAVKN